ncbi:MAG: extensin family protein [Rhodobacteraceae bacterium]|jgi:hypothetical protein|nr:extensin family protein [Paracoccaceae bacterium]
MRGTAAVIAAWLAAGLLAPPGPAWAEEGLASSLFPQARPDVAAVAPADAAIAADTTPDVTPVDPAAPVDPELAAAAIGAALAAVAEAAPAPAPAAGEGAAPETSLRPRARPAAAAAALQTSDAPPAPRGNGICGNPALTGQAIDRIRSRTNGCGVEEPVQITEVAGVRLSTPATMDCVTANALAQWVEQGLQPAYDNQVVGLQVAGHYICRTRNHIRGARISEHGRGKAIDIAGIVLADGTVQTVANNWNRAMRTAYQAGCGIFGTTLGPGSDGYHEDHMHFDTANHRNGPYCR